jgi:hypothetical protein
MVLCLVLHVYISRARAFEVTEGSNPFPQPFFCGREFGQQCHLWKRQEESRSENSA